MNNDLENLIWNIANKLRVTYRPREYRRVMLPMTVLRRLDCVCEPIKEQIVQLNKECEEKEYSGAVIDAKLKELAKKISGQTIYNKSGYNFKGLLDDPNKIVENIYHYIKGFSPKAYDIFKYFNFDEEIQRLHNNNILFSIVQSFSRVELHPDKVSNAEMGNVFEILIRKFNEQAKEEAGDHFTPREVIKLMAHLIYTYEADIFKLNVSRSIYDPTCGTGGMLSESKDYVKNHNETAHLHLHGQEYNAEAYAICCSDLLIKGEDVDKIIFGDTLLNDKTDDEYLNKKYHYMLANPPFGVKWENQKKVVEDEHNKQGLSGRFGPGVPSIENGSLLFLLHMMSKMCDVQPDGSEGSRIAIVFNGSPLFNGGAGSGESNIRRWIIEKDYLDAIIALPSQIFYNTPINTYIWLISNKKKPERQGKIQLIDATEHYEKMRKSLGNKRKYLGDGENGVPRHIREITQIYGDFIHDQTSNMTADKTPRICSKIFNNSDFGFLKITVERPLKLNFCATSERIARLDQESAFIKLTKSKRGKDEADIKKQEQAGKALKKVIREMLTTMNNQLYKNRDDFISALDAQIKMTGIKLEAPVKKAILNALSERDETADTCMKGNKPEPDTDLRDTESVPLPKEVVLPLPIDYGGRVDNSKLVELMRTHCTAYLAKEVLPHVPEAWIDHKKTKVGYEISLKSQFYIYEPPRDLVNIEREIKTQQKEILDTLKEIAS
ncbi:MAG: type I restriction-modification system subunit M [Candidatus Halichondribacter symbioticus]